MSQGALVHVAADAMVDFDYRRERALTEAGDGADGEFSVGRAERELVIGLLDVEFHAHGFQQVSRSAGVAGGTAADGDGVLALRLAIKKRVKSYDAKDLAERKVHLGRYVFQIIKAEIFAGMVFLD